MLLSLGLDINQSFRFGPKQNTELTGDHQPPKSFDWLKAGYPRWFIYFDSKSTRKNVPLPLSQLEAYGASFWVYLL